MPAEPNPIRPPRHPCRPERLVGRGFNPAVTAAKFSRLQPLKYPSIRCNRMESSRAMPCRLRPAVLGPVSRRAASVTPPRPTAPDLKHTAAESMPPRTPCRAGFQPRHHRRKIPAASAADVPLDLPQSNGSLPRNAMPPGTPCRAGFQPRHHRRKIPPASAADVPFDLPLSNGSPQRAKNLCAHVFTQR